MRIKVWLVSLFLFPIFMNATGAYGSPTQEWSGEIPLFFTLNQGQTDSQVRFTVSGNGSAAFFTRKGITFSLSRPKGLPGVLKKASRDDAPAAIPREELTIERVFLGANLSPKIQGEERLAWNSNFFCGKEPGRWQTDVPNYARIRIPDLYPGVDAVCYGQDGHFKYDFTVLPGGDPKIIAWKYDIGDSDALAIREDGDLLIHTPFGEMIEKKPYCYQVIGNARVTVQGCYRIIDTERNICAFSLGEYDPAYPLVIDPALVYSTFVGGRLLGSPYAHYEKGYALAADDGGNVYITGTSYGSDVQIFKLNESGSAPVYAAYIGGGKWGVGPVEYECGNGIAVDTQGNAYVAGVTST
ncbi:MAG: DUF7948 domain-containing protein, partial [Candidatus Latescibacterota bacterium]